LGELGAALEERWREREARGRAMGRTELEAGAGAKAGGGVLERGGRDLQRSFARAERRKKPREVAGGGLAGR
jgi:hypothetical protein